ncbi:flavodoxin family protein [Methanobacterium aggregans]|uniref:flavodoxin family protein n=1 Tax=Methanobacterium aggregans TaxID=1615586 RepID=UPI001AE48FD0|nr:NAD(P)H-dependent oxidoreductase [Methanobacterium aggregans]MBP2046447.1 flavodoxin [Methanobacterium aggregans]
MKIGIVVYSQTEHTYSVAQKLQKRLQEKGNEVELERVVMKGEVHPGSKDMEFEIVPDVEKYDALVFGSPVQAFSLARPMKAYLEQIQSLQGKKISLFVTKGVRFNWTGGNQAISKMKEISQSKGGSIVGTDIIIWNKNRDEKIDALLARFSAIF